MPLNHEQVRQCLDEIEREMFRLVDHSECARFSVESQFSAVLLLLMRCSSMLRSLLLLLDSKKFDAFDAVLRAFEETWNLAFQFRIISQQEYAAKWLIHDGNSWSAHLPTIEKFVKSRGHQEPKLGADYGKLSEIVHPTRKGAENSFNICEAQMQMQEVETALINTAQHCESSVSYRLYRLVWLILDEDDRFIPLYVDASNMRHGGTFAAAYVGIAS